MRPGGGIAALDGAVADDVAAPVDAEAGDDDAAAVGAGAGGDRWIDGDDDALELRPGAEARLGQPVTLPQSCHAVLDDLALELLAADRGVGVAALHLGEEGRRQVGGVVGRARAVGDGGRVGQDVFQERNGTRRGGDDALRQRAQPQRELQVVPGPLGSAPLAQLVAPGGVELGPAQAVGIVGGEDLRDCAAGPDQLVPGDLELRALGG